MSPRERVEKIQEEIEGVASQYGVTSWELTFMASVAERHSLSERQEEILTKIEDKVFA